MASFLPKGKRIHLKLRKATLNRGGSTRQHNFKVELDLSEGDDTLTGLPEWMQNAYTNLARLGNVTQLQKFDVAFNDVTLEFYGSAKARQKMFPVVLKAKLSKFAMTRTGTEDEDVEVKMDFTVLFDTTKQIHEWVFDEDDTDFWLAAESPQQELNLAGAEASEAAEDEEEEAEEGEEYEEGEDEEGEASEGEEDELQAQARRAEDTAARTTPLAGLVTRRTPVITH